MFSFWGALADHLSDDQMAFVAVVADHTRHSPGSRGAKMFVRPDGSQFGTIGGGAMEASIIERAASALSSTEQLYDLQVLEHRRDTGPDSDPSGLICAGKQTMAYWVAVPDQSELYGRFAAAIDADDECELQVKNGAPRLVDRAIDPQRGPITLASKTREFVYSEHAVNHKRVAIVGGGHCGLALSRTMKQLGYRVTLFEVRPDIFTFVENRWADEKQIIDDYADAAALVSYPQLTHFVVMTADYPSDVRALLGGLDGTFPFVGAMGSEAKLTAIRRELLASGLAQERIDELYAPIGLQMTSNTPEEIAISIAAQVLREREKLFPWSQPTTARSR